MGDFCQDSTIFYPVFGVSVARFLDTGMMVRIAQTSDIAIICFSCQVS